MFIPLQPTPPDESGVVARAGDERRRLRHDYLGTEHILLALVSDRGDDVAGVLRDAGVRRSAVLGQIREFVPAGSRTAPGRLSVTPKAREVIEGAGELAVVLDDARLEPRHYLISLLAEVDSVAVEMLDRMQIDRGNLLELSLAGLFGVDPVDPPELIRTGSGNLVGRELREDPESGQLVRLKVDRYFARRREDTDRAQKLAAQIAQLERKRQRRLEVQQERMRFDRKGVRADAMSASPDTTSSKDDHTQSTEEEVGNESEDRRSAQD